MVFENAYLNAGASLVEENIVIVDGRLSIREGEATTIIANEIKTFGEQKQKVLILNITDVNEEEKEKLRGAIKYFTGEMNNIAVVVQDGEKELNCGGIYLTEKIFEIFKEIVGDENIHIFEK